MLQPEASGLCVSPDGTLLVKNISSIGVMTGGTLNFKLTLKGAAWLDQLQGQGLLVENMLSPNATLAVTMTVGDARHVASCVLKIAVR